MNSALSYPETLFPRITCFSSFGFTVASRAGGLRLGLETGAPLLCRLRVDGAAALLHAGLFAAVELLLIDRCVPERREAGSALNGGH